MTPPQICEIHADTIEKMASISSLLSVATNNLAIITDRVNKHHHAADKQGGFRDRVIIIEETQKRQDIDIVMIRKQIWKIGILSGVIGGLIGKLTPELVNALLRVLIRT